MCSTVEDYVAKLRAEQNRLHLESVLPERDPATRRIFSDLQEECKDLLDEAFCGISIQEMRNRIQALRMTARLYGLNLHL
jgi:hypothetical protein